MKNKGFTLIELLAVIVILAIIALIAIPIIINIINDARESAKQKSRELYGKAVENAVLKYQLDGTVLPDGDYALDISTGQVCHTEQNDKCVTPEVEGEKPVVYTMEIEDGKITNQTIKLHSTDPLYTKEGNGKWTKGDNSNEESTEQAVLPRYYYIGGGDVAEGLPEDASLTNTYSESYPYYLAFDSADGETIDAAYACSIIGEESKEYCVKVLPSYDDFELKNDIYCTSEDMEDSHVSTFCDEDGVGFEIGWDNYFECSFVKAYAYYGSGYVVLYQNGTYDYY